MVRSHKAGSCCHRRTSLHSQAHHAPSSATHHLESRRCTCKNSPCRKSITQLLRCDNNTTAIRTTTTLRQCNYYYLTTMQLLLQYLTTMQLLLRCDNCTLRNGFSEYFTYMRTKCYQKKISWELIQLIEHKTSSLKHSEMTQSLNQKPPKRIDAIGMIYS